MASSRMRPASSRSARSASERIRAACSVTGISGVVSSALALLDATSRLSVGAEATVSRGRAFISVDLLTGETGAGLLHGGMGIEKKADAANLAGDVRGDVPGDLPATGALFVSNEALVGLERSAEQDAGNEREGGRADDTDANGGADHGDRG